MSHTSPPETTMRAMAEPLQAFTQANGLKGAPKTLASLCLPPLGVVSHFLKRKFILFIFFFFCFVGFAGFSCMVWS